MSDLADLQKTAASIETDTGVHVSVLPTSVLGMGYEVSARGQTYGPFKTDAAKMWLNGFWNGAR